MNDADIEMIELAAAGASIAAGVCPRCDEYLTGPDAAAYGGDGGDGYHEQCVWRAPHHAGVCVDCELPEQVDRYGRCRWCV